MAIVKSKQGVQSDDELHSMIKQDPNRPGKARGRLDDHEIPVWGLILYLMSAHALDDPLEASDDQIADTANAYDIPDVAVRAALVYYRHHRRQIDALITLNADVIGAE